MSNESRNKLVVKMYNDQVKKNKTEIGRKFGISARTVGRILDKAKSNSSSDGSNNIKKIIVDGLEFTPHDGENLCPIPSGIHASVLFGNGSVDTNSFPELWNWKWVKPDSPGDYDIVGYHAHEEDDDSKKHFGVDLVVDGVEYTPHDGESMPVSKNDIVSVLFHSSERADPVPASDWDWIWEIDTPSFWDIVGYYIHEYDKKENVIDDPEEMPELDTEGKACQLTHHGVSLLADGIKFMPWDGTSSECPVPEGSVVSVLFGQGDIERDNQPEGWTWKWFYPSPESDDIIGYFNHSSDANKIASVEVDTNVAETNKEPKFLVTSNTVMIAIDDEIHTVDSSHGNFNLIKEAISQKDFELAIELSDIIKAVSKYSSGDVEVTCDSVKYKGKEFSNDLTNRILDSMANGVKPKELACFMNNVMQNTSYRAINELFRFLRACSLPITSDGYFLAYKKVRSDYTDGRTGTIDNSIGSKPSMLRSDVDDDSNNTCSTGFHFCSLKYLDNSIGGSRVMVVKIHPKDVVSIPKDYNDSKGRCCEYEVIGELGNLYCYSEIPDFIVDDEFLESIK